MTIDLARFRSGLACLLVGVLLGGLLHYKLDAATVNTWSINAGKASFVRVQGPAVLEELPSGQLRLRSAWPLEVSDAPAPVTSQ